MGDLRVVAILEHVGADRVALLGRQLGDICVATSSPSQRIMSASSAVTGTGSIPSRSRMRSSLEPRRR